MIIETRPSQVGTERIESTTPVVIFDGDRDELIVRIGEVDVRACAFEITYDVARDPPDFVAATVRRFTRVLGEDRIDRLVVFERQPLTCDTRMVDGHYTPDKTTPPHQVWSYYGRFGFVAYLK